MIPAEAVEAAYKGWREQAALDGSIFEYNLRAALEAAAPHMLAELERELTEAQRVIALLLLEAGGKVALSRRVITELSDDTVIETTQDIINGGWVLRVKVGARGDD